MNDKGRLGPSNQWIEHGCNDPEVPECLRACDLAIVPFSAEIPLGR